MINCEIAGLSACISQKRQSKLFQIFRTHVACGPWLGPCLATMQCFMHFQFCGRRHVSCNKPHGAWHWWYRRGRIPRLLQASAACRATCGATRVRKCACTLNVIHSFSKYLPREARPHCIYAMALRTGGEDCYVALAALASQPLKSGTLSLYLSVPVPVLTPSVVISRPTTASRPSNPLNPSPLAPQIRLC